MVNYILFGEESQAGSEKNALVSLRNLVNMNLRYAIQKYVGERALPVNIKQHDDSTFDWTHYEEDSSVDIPYAYRMKIYM